MVNSIMKKNYIIPSTATLAFQCGFVCGVGSVQGNSGLGLGGDAGDSPTTIDPL